MTGPEHFRAAEGLLSRADKVLDAATVNTVDECIAMVNALYGGAVAHAQLAAVAAHINTKAVPEFPLAKAPDINADLTWKDVIQ